MQCRECDETREHRHELGMRVFAPVAPKPPGRSHTKDENRDSLGRGHMENLRKMIDPTGEHGFTKEELAHAYYSERSADAVIRLNRLLCERCPDLPDLRFPKPPSQAGMLELRELIKDQGFCLKTVTHTPSSHVIRVARSSGIRREYGRRKK